MSETAKYFASCKDTPRGRNASVHYSQCRFAKAVEQRDNHEPVAIDKVIKHTNCFLKQIGINRVVCPRVEIPPTGLTNLDYEKIKKKNGLTDARDIVWMKFTTDGYLGVVASSNDINFDRPPDKESYHNKTERGRWQCTSSGIIIHSLGQEWNTSFVLVFPLSGIQEEQIPEAYRTKPVRGAIERAIGNYLIAMGVPILDFYSHNY